MTVRKKHLTYTRAQRAITAIVDVMECEEFSGLERQMYPLRDVLEAACDKLREIREAQAQ